jgi:hypothetical protein
MNHRLNPVSSRGLLGLLEPFRKCIGDKTASFSERHKRLREIIGLPEKSRSIPESEDEVEEPELNQSAEN